MYFILLEIHIKIHTLIWQDWGRAWESAFLESSQMMPIPLLHKLHFSVVKIYSRLFLNSGENFLFLKKILFLLYLFLFIILKGNFHQDPKDEARRLKLSLVNLKNWLQKGLTLIYTWCQTRLWQVEIACIVRANYDHSVRSKKWRTVMASQEKWDFLVIPWGPFSKKTKGIWRLRQERISMFKNQSEANVIRDPII